MYPSILKMLLNHVGDRRFLKILNRRDYLIFLFGPRSPHLTNGNLLRRAPRIGIINKHAVLLPSCKGVFPHSWAVITGIATGVTFHRVSREIDGGKILVQRVHPEPHATTQRLSMLSLYLDMFRMYPGLAAGAAQRLIAGHSTDPRAAVTPSYFSFPDREDYRRFRRSGGALARNSDLFHRRSC